MKIRFSHRLLAFLLLLVLPVFVMKRYTLLKHTSRGKFEKHELMTQEVHAQKDKMFRIILADESQFDENIVKSILDQSYHHFSLTYLTFFQEDKIKLKNLADEYHLNKKQVDVVICTNQQEMIQSCHHVINQAQDDDIVVYLGSTNYLANKRALSQINEIYKTENVFLCFTQYIEERTDKKGAQIPFTTRKEWSTKKTQKHFWLQSYVKVFYAGLYKQLNFQAQDFSEFISIDEFMNDQLKPVAELSKKHIRFIPEVLYIHIN